MTTTALLAPGFNYIAYDVFSRPMLNGYRRKTYAVDVIDNDMLEQWLASDDYWGNRQEFIDYIYKNGFYSSNVVIDIILLLFNSTQEGKLSWDEIKMISQVIQRENEQALTYLSYY